MPPRQKVTSHAHDRPAEFDKLLVDYLPLARKLAHRMRGNDDAEEIVQDFYVDACNRWATYDDSYAFGTFVFQLVRNTVQNRKTYRRSKKRADIGVSLDHNFDFGLKKNWLSIPAGQHDYAELSETLRNLSGTRDSEALMRLAMGDSLAEVGADMGVSGERVRQLAERERAALRAVA